MRYDQIVRTTTKGESPESERKAETTQTHLGILLGRPFLERFGTALPPSTRPTRFGCSTGRQIPTCTIGSAAADSHHHQSQRQTTTTTPVSGLFLSALMMMRRSTWDGTPAPIRCAWNRTPFPSFLQHLCDLCLVEQFNDDDFDDSDERLRRRRKKKKKENVNGRPKSHER
jgi:hypothetical protein